MRRLEVVYRPEAIADLQEIYLSVLNISRNKSTAFGLYQRVVDRCERVGLVPLGGRQRDDLEPGLRTVHFERKAVIAYHIKDNRVEIVNVFYGGRDYETIYRNSGEEGEPL